MKALLTLPVALAALVVAAPNALGSDKPQSSTFITDTLGGNGGVRPASTHGVLDAVKRSSPNQVGLAWQYLRDTGQITTPSTPPRLDDRAGARGIDPGSTVIVDSPTQFDWNDAGTGAASAAGLMMLLGGAALTQRRNRRRTRTTV